MDRRVCVVLSNPPIRKTMGSFVNTVLSRSQVAVAVSTGFARLFAGQSEPIVFSDSSAARGVCRRVGCGRLKCVLVRFLWLHEVVADGRVEVRSIDTWLQSTPADKEERHCSR